MHTSYPTLELITVRQLSHLWMKFGTWNVRILMDNPRNGKPKCGVHCRSPGFAIVINIDITTLGETGLARHGHQKKQVEGKNQNSDVIFMGLTTDYNNRL